MKSPQLTRRNFLSLLPAIPLAAADSSPINQFPIACNDYNWITFYKREGKTWGGTALDQNIAELAQTGIKAFEPNIADPAMAESYITALRKYEIAMPSIYVGSNLHEPEGIENSITRIMAIARIAKSYGTKIIVTNPNPIKWGTDQLKSDAQLSMQALAMEKLGNKLRQQGMKLAYHTHNIELKAAAREFHHILLNTTPKNVSFCFDVHWVYRGSENSQAAVFDILKLYGNRIVELHIRQSNGGIWSETFSAEGDVDYARLVSQLSAMKIRPHLVIEQCLEPGSPHTMNVVEAHKKDLAAVTATFRQLL
ncbi:sugar phosphate isomerase/epimerase [Dyadobacter sp. CY261]|uniref:sugar phosphate isomerase/epimerase family protein n=1 Tax=Dyadobacter sp. CY261 TaxID=2907203 RepID=UPI001F1F5359|nr:sugar phosphate isomerase/epimerase [Dyadobacter sp. CY261]MCF0069715.1 sugar phosphate isomerase/epimerase [Dyadobacter sp. CY261]